MATNRTAPQSTITLAQALVIAGEVMTVWTKFQASKRDTPAIIESAQEVLTLLTNEGVTLEELGHLITLLTPFIGQFRR